jgi:hypothetical protein
VCYALITIFLSFLPCSNILEMQSLHIYTLGKEFCFTRGEFVTHKRNKRVASACMSSGEDNQSWSYLVGAEVIDYAGERNIAPLRHCVIFERCQKLGINLERWILA